MTTDPVVSTPAEPHGIVHCDNDPTPHSRTDECVNPWPAKWTPGAGVELLRREHPEMVPEVSGEDRAAADRIMTSQPAESREPDLIDDLEMDGSPEGVSIRAELRAAYERGKAEAQAHAVVIVPCQDAREVLDGALCTGEFRYAAVDVQAKCTVCGGWRGRYAPVDMISAVQLAYERGLREATEGWEREHAVQMNWLQGPTVVEVEPRSRENAEACIAQLSPVTRGIASVVSRLVGPWEPAPATADREASPSVGGGTSG